LHGNTNAGKLLLLEEAVRLHPLATSSTASAVCSSIMHLRLRLRLRLLLLIRILLLLPILILLTSSTT
jgi:hypothetical protein